MAVHGIRAILEGKEYLYVNSREFAGDIYIDYLRKLVKNRFLELSHSPPVPLYPLCRFPWQFHGRHMQSFPNHSHCPQRHRYFPWESPEFNEVDNLIFSELVYVDFKGIVPPPGKGESITLKEASRIFFLSHTEEEINER